MPRRQIEQLGEQIERAGGSGNVASRQQVEQETPGHCQYGRRTTSVEHIPGIDELRRVAYTVVSGIPVKSYRAEVTLTPTATGGTSIHCAASWDKTVMGSLVRRKLVRVYFEIVAALVAGANQHVASSARH
ncbi:MAG: SRPBCC family protein [Acidimicrobiales bacterium]